jgi:hypothetical protein
MIFFKGIISCTAQQTTKADVVVIKLGIVQIYRSLSFGEGEGG